MLTIQHVATQGGTFVEVKVKVPLPVIFGFGNNRCVRNLNNLSDPDGATVAFETARV